MLHKQKSARSTNSCSKKGLGKKTRRQGDRETRGQESRGQGAEGSIEEEYRIQNILPSDFYLDKPLTPSP
ncbi:hypothetical protein PCC6912_62610 [Chlorogloeopsis fritschii PCC 6912]|uniref:Uncharacterized protein n=1 Tax=Chlorogloeopsis fritschii PCC 6912 TaxID=211165 RepID=A0A3S0ZKX1_CHLFR|nr:hypothetical protein PCC6912_62610 [Chlorogloeopsis fritschii PCC 6912]